MDQHKTVRLLRTTSRPIPNGRYCYEISDPALDTSRYSNVTERVFWAPLRVGRFRQPCEVPFVEQPTEGGLHLTLVAGVHRR